MEQQTYNSLEMKRQLPLSPAATAFGGATLRQPPKVEGEGCEAPGGVSFGCPGGVLPPAAEDVSTGALSSVGDITDHVNGTFSLEYFIGLEIYSISVEYNKIVFETSKYNNKKITMSHEQCCSEPVLIKNIKNLANLFLGKILEINVTTALQSSFFPSRVGASRLVAPPKAVLI